MRLRKLPALIGVAISTMAVLFSNSPSAAYLLVGSGDVLRFDETTGAFIDVFIPLNIGGVFDMTFGPDGALYMPAATGDVLRFNGFTGGFLGVFVPKGSGGLDANAAVAFGPDCSFYVASYSTTGDDQVLRYQGKTGDFVDVFVPPGSGGVKSISAMAFGPDGNLYVVDGDVLRYDGRTGAFLGTFVPEGAGGLPFALRLAFGPDGNLYVAAGGDQPRIYKFDGNTGAFLDVFGEDLNDDSSFITALAIGPDGLLYVSVVVGFRFSLVGIFRYDGETGAPLGAFIQPDGAQVPVLSLAFTPKTDVTLIDDIVGLIASARLPSGTEASLNASLRNARVALNEGRLIPAGNELNAFKNKVQANTGNLIPVPQANRMVIAADALRNTLACR